MSDKPRHRSGYSREELRLVESACLTVAVTIGAYLEDVCIVGGLVPALLIDAQRPADLVAEDHPGTNDLDIGLALALLDDERYVELSARLRAEGFRPDKNAKDNPTVQRWCMEGLKVTVDFLMPPSEGDATSQRVKPLEPDFGALVTPGLELAFDERVEVDIEGFTLKGEAVSRKVPVCGPGAFTVLKALAFGDRAEPKDAYDLVYVVRHTEGAGQAVARVLSHHAETHEAIVLEALSLLRRDFGSPDGLGPSRAADFMLGDDSDRDADAADAHGFVDDLLRAASEEGLSVP